MNENAETRPHPGALLYVIVAAFLCVLTAMELMVVYVHAMKPVLVPVLLVLAAAKFALVALFYMHLRYDSRILGAVFGFGVLIASILAVSLLMLFIYLSHHMTTS